MPSTPEAVARYYDAWTESYLAAFGACIQAHRPASDTEFLDYLMRRIGFTPGTRALDAGCGVAGPARHFAALAGVSIEALTISPAQASKAVHDNKAAGLQERIRVRMGDFHDLETLYGRNVFDIVYFLESLSHSTDPARALRSAYAVLKPGGHVYVKDFFIRPCNGADTQHEVLDVVARVNELFVVETAWADDIIRHLHEAGFTRVFVEHPHFNVDNSRWQAFERHNDIDLFVGKDSFDWSEWFEMKFQKPFA